MRHPSVDPSTGYIIVSAKNSNIVYSGLSLRPDRMYDDFCFDFPSFLLLSALLPSFLPFSSTFSGVRMCHGYDLGVMSLQVKRDGIPYLVSTFPLGTITAVHVLLCFLPS